MAILKKRFEGQVVVVTGSSRGIGVAIAEEFAREGASLVITARSTKDQPHHVMTGTLDETEARLRELGADVLQVAADVATEAGCTAIYDATMARFGRCDILVNNAGISYISPFLEGSIKRWHIQFGVNVHGPMMLIRAFLPGMLAQGKGRIVNISSGAGRIEPRTSDRHEGPVGLDHAQMAAYGAAKAALNRLTTILGDEYAGTGVTINALDVAAVTQIYATAMQGVDLSTLELPEAPAQIVAWIAAQGADYTGNLLDQGERLASLRPVGEIRPRVAPAPIAAVA